MNDQHSSNQATQSTASLVRAHVPVLLNETIRALSINPSGVYLDATFGRGGHCRAMLKELSRDGRVIALDRDPQLHRGAVFSLSSTCDSRTLFTLC